MNKPRRRAKDGWRGNPQLTNVKDALRAFPRTETISKAERMIRMTMKPKPPEAPRLPNIPRLNESGQAVDYFAQFERELRERYSRDRRRKVLHGLSKRRRQEMSVEIVPAPAVDPRRLCGLCQQPMSEEFHPAASDYLCAVAMAS